MQPVQQNQSILKVISPYGLALISYAVFLFACLIPPSVYKHFVGEQDLMFLDPATILFYSLCVAGFMAGVWLIGWLFPGQLQSRVFHTRLPAVVVLLVPAVLGLLLTSASIFNFVRTNPTIVLLLMSQQGQEMKESGSSEGGGSTASLALLLLAIAWWVYARSHQAKLTKTQRRVVRTVVVLALLCVIATATVFISRSLLMMSVSGFVLLYILQNALKQGDGKRSLGLRGVAIAAVFPILFFAFSFLRGTSGWEAQVQGLIGYTAASYNRLAAIVNGTLRYPYGGRGVYLSSFVSYSHALHRIVPLDRMMGWPEYVEVWGSEFSAVSRASLSGGAIWSGAFGYIFSDLGWFSVFFLFGYGLLYGAAWNWFKRGTALGVILYPAFGFCALFWLGSNFLLDSQIVLLLVVAVMIGIYERLLTRPAGRIELPDTGEAPGGVPRG